MFLPFGRHDNLYGLLCFVMFMQQNVAQLTTYKCWERELLPFLFLPSGVSVILALRPFTSSHGGENYTAHAKGCLVPHRQATSSILLSYILYHPLLPLNESSRSPPARSRARPYLFRVTPDLRRPSEQTYRPTDATGRVAAMAARAMEVYFLPI